jgi:hypothetical protein
MLSHRPLLAAMSLSLLAALSPLTSHAASKHKQEPAKEAAASGTSTAALKVSTLGGKFTFTLPAGFAANPLPAGDAAHGTEGASGTMYLNEALKRVIIVTESPIPNGTKVSDNDDTFLDGAAAGLSSQQRAGLPDYQKVSEKSMKINTLGVRQIDSTGTMGGGKTITTTLVAGSGTRMTAVEVVSRAADQSSHDAFVQQIVSGKPPAAK